MEGDFSGLVIDPAKCNELSLEEKRELVHEISQWAENAPEILQSWSRKELLQLICAEMGKERKYSGLTKPKMIAYLLKLVTEKNIKRRRGKDIISSPSPKDKNGIKKKRKKEHQSELVTVTDQDQSKDNIDNLVCQNLACRAALNLEDKYCKRCSCCICYRYDDNKDPSLWLVCSSDPPFCNESCGMSCHLKCALKHEKAGILKNGCYAKLDGSFYCVCCGKMNWLIQTWLKQLLIAKDVRRVDVLCERVSLSHKILKGTERYKELHNIANEAAKKLKKELGPLDKVSTVMARGIVNRLACGAEVQKLCSSAVEAVSSILSGTSNQLMTVELKAPGPQAFRIKFEDIQPSSVVVSFQSKDEIFEENIIGCRLWHRSSDVKEFPEAPTCIVPRPETRIKVSGLNPSTEYYFKASPFSCTKEMGKWEAKCSTRCSNNTGALGDSSPNLKEKDIQEQPVIVEADSQRGSTNSSDNAPTLKLPTQKKNDSPQTFDLPPPSGAVHRASSDSVPPGKALIGSPNSANMKESSAVKKSEEAAEREYEYCVKVIRWLECEGHMEKEFRVKFLTWFSLKATKQERRVVSAFINVLIDEPVSLVAQLMDAFMDGICNKEKPDERRGFCTRLWH